MTWFVKSFVNLSRPGLRYSFQWNPEAGAHSLVPAWASLSSWDQCSPSQLGLIAADAVRCAVGCKVENRLSTPHVLNRQTRKGSVASKGRRFGREIQGICRGNSGGARFAEGPRAFLVQHCWRQCLMSSVSDPHLYFLLSSHGLESNLCFCYSSCYWSGCLSNFPSPWKTHPWVYL